MNRLTSRGRKLLYAVLLVVLAVPIILLGRPSSGDEDLGGVLARLRELPEDQGGYGLGRTTMGRIDPSSATMNLVLLGLRGVAANVLWMQHEEQKRTKNWAQMSSTTESIITLQPHFLEVWRFHGWNLAWNVAAEWDAVVDRWWWVKQGGKFTMRGIEQNRIYAELPWEVGRTIGQKLGVADEWRQYREFFMEDPDVEKFRGGPDPTFHRSPHDPREVPPGTRFPVEPRFPHGFLCAKSWYLLTNEVLAQHGRHGTGPMTLLMRHYPVRSQFDYANALQQAGDFDETARFQWDRAYREWTGEEATRLSFDNFDYLPFGKEQFETPEAGTLMLNPSHEDLRTLARKDVERLGTPLLTAAERDADADPPDDAELQQRLIDYKREWVQRYQNILNFLYWKRRASLEKRDEMVAVHRALYEGRQAVRQGLVNYGPNGEPPKSVEHFEQAMRQFEELLKELEQSAESSEEVRDRQLIEKILLGMVYWRYIIETLNGRAIPEEYPLKDLWDSEDAQSMLPDVRMQFQREAQE